MEVAMKNIILACAVIVASLSTSLSLAHHVMGRPSYSLGDDSNTPPSQQVETQIGKYLVTYMAFPAFPKANEAGRVNLYLVHTKTGSPYNGEVTFSARSDSWFSRKRETLGVQVIDDNVYRQGYQFHKEGKYIITAKFKDNDEPYQIDFPLRVGEPFPLGPVGLVVIAIIGTILAVNVTQRRRRVRLQTERQVSSREEGPTQAE